MATHYWVNPPPYLSRGFQAQWVVGEQQNLSWVTAVESSNNLTLVQNRGEELGNLGIYYMLIIFNYATYIKQTNKYDHSRNSCQHHDWL